MCKNQVKITQKGCIIMKQITINGGRWNTDSKPSIPHLGRNKELIQNENAKRQRIGDNRRIIDSPDNPYHTYQCWQAYDNLEDAYTDIFGVALTEWNEHQRKSRRKTMQEYMQKTASDKSGKPQTHYEHGHKVTEERTGKELFKELIFSVGTTEQPQDDSGRTLPVRYDKHHKEIHPLAVPDEVAYAVLKQQYETFEERHPHFRIYRWDFHGDEQFKNKKGVWEYGTMHAHACIIPAATGYKGNQMQVQSAIGRALSQEGFKGHYEETQDGKRKYVNPYREFADNEEQYLFELTTEEMKKYCAEHPEYAAEHGSDIELIHLYKDRDSNEMQLPARLYGALQDTKKDQQQQAQQLDERELRLNAKEQNLAEQEQELIKRKKHLKKKEKAAEDAKDLYEQEFNKTRADNQKEAEQYRRQIERQVWAAAEERIQAYAEDCYNFKTSIVQQLSRLGLTAAANQIDAQQPSAKPDMYAATAADLQQPDAPQPPDNTNDYNYTA